MMNQFTNNELAVLWLAAVLFGGMGTLLIAHRLPMFRDEHHKHQFKLWGCLVVGGAYWVSFIAIGVLMPSVRQSALNDLEVLIGVCFIGLWPLFQALWAFDDGRESRGVRRPKWLLAGWLIALCIIAGLWIVLYFVF